MDLLIVARETADSPPTPTEVTDPAQVQSTIRKLQHGIQVSELLSRMSLGVLVLAKSLDRAASRAAIGIALQRSKSRGAVLLSAELGRELLGEGLPLQGGIREMHSKPLAAIGRARDEDVVRLLQELSERAGIPWAPPGSRAAPARTVVRAEEAEGVAAGLIQREQWAQAVDVLRSAEPLGPRGTNMLGRALLALGQREEARQAFERTIATDPTNGIAQRQLASLGVAVAAPTDVRAQAPTATAPRPRTTQRATASGFRIVEQGDEGVTFEVDAAKHTDGQFPFPREVQQILGVKTGDEVRLRIETTRAGTPYIGVQRLKGGDEIRDRESLAWYVHAGERVRVTATRR